MNKASTVEQITVWAAHGDGGNEYRTGPVLAYCLTESQAIEAAKSQGWYGSNGAVINHAALRIDDKIWLLAAREPIKV